MVIVPMIYALVKLFKYLSFNRGDGPSYLERACDYLALRTAPKGDKYPKVDLNIRVGLIEHEGE